MYESILEVSVSVDVERVAGPGAELSAVVLVAASEFPRPDGLARWPVPVYLDSPVLGGLAEKFRWC